MAIFGGGTSASKQEPAIGSFRVMSQGYGVTVPVVMGTARVQCVLIDYLDFYHRVHRERQGGKGGGEVVTSTYSYYATVLLLCCAGGGYGVNYRRLWVNKNVYDTPDLKGFAEFDGADGQAAWGYMLGKHPGRALAYKGFAYLAAHDYALTNSASLGNHGVEVEGFYARVGPGKDAAVADCITGLLLNNTWGVDFGVDKLLPLARLDDYCTSHGLSISPALTEQEAAKDVLARWATIAHCGAIWTQNAAGDGGALKFVPLSQTAHSGNGRDYLPAAPLDIYLSADDFLADSGEEPVLSTPKDRAEADNSFVVEFDSRAKEYNKMLSPAAVDAAAVGLYGLRKAPAFVAKEIKRMGVARRVAQNLLQAAQYGGGRHEARLSSWQYAYLEPGDVVFLHEPEWGFDNWPVMVVEVMDDGDVMSVVFEDVPDGVGDSDDYPADDAQGGRVPWNVPVGDVNPPVLFHAPAALTDGGHEIWCAVSHPDRRFGGCQVWYSYADTDFKLAGVMNGQSTVGVLAADFAAGPDPDTNAGNLLLVDLAQSGGSLASVSHDDAHSYESLCLAGEEFMAYRDATRVGGHYNLTTPNPVSVTATATAVTSAVRTEFAGLHKDTGYYNGGTIACTAGAAGNVGISRAVTSYVNAAGVKAVTHAPFPVLPAVGDVFVLTPLPYLRRGLFGSAKGALAGAPFVRCDNRLFRFKFGPKDIGRLLRLKFLAYNQHGQAVQSLADVPSYAITLARPPAGGGVLEPDQQWIID